MGLTAGKLYLVGGFALHDGTSAEFLTRVRDHCLLRGAAKLMHGEPYRSVWRWFQQALARFCVPGRMLTGSWKVFNGRQFRSRGSFVRRNL